MTESQFIEQNKEKWAELELLLSQPNKDADKLQELFVKVSSDLSYARTFYPKRSVRLYLNNLTQQVFDSMGKKKSGFGKQNIIDFFGHILPQEAYRQRYKLLLSFIIFSISMLVGAVTLKNNPEFAEVILGNDYIRITEENINNLDPMAIYKDENAIGMFEYITLNNIKVAFNCFVLGILGGIGTCFFLVYNGIMVGVFQYYFYTKGLFLTSFLTIWIHGTIEISAIIIAGAAGLVLGSGLLFPGTYKRSTSLQISAKRALRLVLGTVPLFIIAGLLESFVTRLTGLPMAIKVIIILLSLLLILFMFVFYPQYYHRKIAPVESNPKVFIQKDDEIYYDQYRLRSVNENLSLSFTQFRTFFMINCQKVILPATIVCSVLFYFLITINNASYDLIDEFRNMNDANPFNFETGGIFTPMAVSLFIAIGICYMELFLKNKMQHTQGAIPFFKKHFIFTFVITLLIFLASHQVGAWAFLAVILVPPQAILALFDLRYGNSKYDTNTFSHNIKIAYFGYLDFLFPFILSLSFFLIFVRVAVSGISGIIVSLFTWHNVFDSYLQTYSFIAAILFTIVLLALMPLIYFMYHNFYYSAKCKKESIDLQSRLASFGQEQKMFE